MKQRENQRRERPEEEVGKKKTRARERALTTCQRMINSYNPIISPSIINNSGQACQVAAPGPAFHGTRSIIDEATGCTGIVV